MQQESERRSRARAVSRAYSKRARGVQELADGEQEEVMLSDELLEEMMESKRSEMTDGDDGEQEWNRDVAESSIHQWLDSMMLSSLEAKLQKLHSFTRTQEAHLLLSSYSSKCLSILAEDCFSIGCPKCLSLLLSSPIFERMDQPMDAGLYVFISLLGRASRSLGDYSTFLPLDNIPNEIEGVSISASFNSQLSLVPTTRA
ncbi:hypothetical protein L7F22_012492 [Adiantum nelumboides]|nr:hypothetical protein [Adiantum nelumboides]